MCLILLCVAIIFVIFFCMKSNVKYPLHDCVTYFDGEARYQLVDVGKEYHIMDASKGKSLCSNVKYYLYQNDKLYLIYDKNIGEENCVPYYGVLDTTSDEFTETNLLGNVETEFAYDKADMIDLTKRQNPFIKWLTDFLPHKIRKR